MPGCTEENMLKHFILNCYYSKEVWDKINVYGIFSENVLKTEHDLPVPSQIMAFEFVAESNVDGPFPL